MITIESQGEWKLTRNWFDRMTKLDLALIMNQFGKEGVSALAAATPSRSGLTSKSWNYEVTRKGNNWKITWTNSNVNKGANIAVLIQYGHGTRNGGYVVGRDYINPAIRPVFDKIAKQAWKEVTR
nr:MAG TPA: type I neck protein [Caudoviricetes sp.]